MPKAVVRKLLAQQTSEGRFSRTDMWLDLMKDLTSVRVVNGKHKDGSMTPMLLTSSEMRLGGQKLYSLLFEPIRDRDAAIVTTCHDGIIQTASDSVKSIFGRRARAICGERLSTFFEDDEDAIERSLAANKKNRLGQKNLVGAPVDMVLKADDWTPVIVEVIDSRNNIYVVTLKLGELSDRKVTRKQLTYDEEGLKTQKGGVDPEATVDAEEIGFYTVVKALGVGQCGLVRQGMHRTTGTNVAIKTLTRETFDQVGLKWPGKELELMSHLRHPHIVQLYDCIQAADRMYLVLELVSNGELLSYCYDHGTLPEDQARSFMRDIISGVDYLHRKGIVHRDLKLENCLLTEQKRVKLIDFGLAAYYLQGNLKTSCGSSDYAAPELFTSSLYYGPPVDVWAMGVILFSMVAGEFPFEDIQATLDVNYEWPISPHRSLSTLIEGMFDLNPDLRLTVEQIRRNDWVNTGYSGPPLRVTTGGGLEGGKVRSGELSRPFDVKKDVLDIRFDLLVMMEQEHGFVLEGVVEAILSESIDQFTATYKMLLSKFPNEVATDAEAIERARAVVAEIRKQREIGSMSVNLDLSKIRLAVRQRHRKSDMAFRHGGLSAPPSPRKENDAPADASTDSLASMLEAAFDNPDKSDLRSSPARPRTTTRERSITYGGPTSSTPPLPRFISVKPNPSAVGSGTPPKDSLKPVPSRQRSHR